MSSHVSVTVEHKTHRSFSYHSNDVKDHAVDKPHKGESINNVNISPNDKYLVTYSNKDQSIVGWNVEDADEGRLEPDVAVTTSDSSKYVTHICVSDDKKLVYIYNDWKYLGE